MKTRLDVDHADRQLGVKAVRTGFTVALSGCRGAYNWRL